jgi:hypothetical protein
VGRQAGPDSLIPEYTKDLLLETADDNPLLAVVMDLINLLLAGMIRITVRTRHSVRAILVTIAKKHKGIRPIALGYVWRRLTAKVACSQFKEASATLLAPRQLGCGVARAQRQQSPLPDVT